MLKFKISPFMKHFSKNNHLHLGKEAEIIVDTMCFDFFLNFFFTIWVLFQEHSWIAKQ